MHKIAIICAASLVLGACGTTGSKEFDHFEKAVTEIAKDPNCGHTDRIQGNLGGVAANNFAFYFERTCAPKAPPLSPAMPGTTVNPATFAPPPVAPAPPGV